MDFGLHWQQRPKHSSAVVAGLGVSVLGIHSTAIGMRILQPEEGFPALSGMDVMLYGEEKFEGSIAKALFSVHETVLSRMWERASMPPVLAPVQVTVIRQKSHWHDRCSRIVRVHLDSVRRTQRSIMKRRKRTDPINLLIEATLVAGFLSAIGFLVSVTNRLVF